MSCYDFSKFRLFSWSSVLLLLAVLFGSNSLESPDSPYFSTDPDGFIPQESQNVPTMVVTNPHPTTFEPVAFSAIHASSSTRRSVSQIAFERTVTDIGNGWNSLRSEFVGYHPGLYFFTFTALSSSGTRFKYHSCFSLFDVLLFYNCKHLLKGFAYEKRRRTCFYLG